MRRLALSVALLGLVGLGPVQAAELYDPNLVPYDARPVSLPQCGVSIGLDRTWRFETREKSTENATEYFYDFRSDSKLNPRPFDVFVFNPQITGYINCHASFDKERQRRTGEQLQRHVKSFVGRLRKTATEKSDYVNVSEIVETKIAGLDIAYTYHADIPPEKDTEFTSRGVAVWLAGTKGDVFVSGWIRLSDPVGGKTRAPKGSTAQGKDKGVTMTVKLENDATLVKKVYYGSRTLDQDRDYLMRVLRSIQ
jgi:hypothetical protein